MRNRLDVMQLLIEQGADLEIEGDDGRFYMYGTPLSVATYYYNTAAVKLLLEHGADVNHRPRLEGGRTVLFVAIVSKQLHLVELLLSHGADANVFADYQDKRERYHNKVCGYSPLHAALRSFSSIRRVRRNSRIDPLQIHPGNSLCMRLFSFWRCPDPLQGKEAAKLDVLWKQKARSRKTRPRYRTITIFSP